MDGDVLVGRIQGRLDAYDAEHYRLGRRRRTHCVHDAVAAIRAVLDVHQAGQVPTFCTGCLGLWPCPTLRVIAEKLGIATQGGS